MTDDHAAFEAVRISAWLTCWQRAQELVDYSAHYSVFRTSLHREPTPGHILRVRDQVYAQIGELDAVGT